MSGTFACLLTMAKVKTLYLRPFALCVNKINLSMCEPTQCTSRARTACTMRWLKFEIVLIVIIMLEIIILYNEPALDHVFN